MDSLRNPRGSLSLALLFVLSLLLVTGLGIWGFARHWRILAEIQLSIDRCVGRKALELSETQDGIIAANREILALRISRGAATLLPAAIPAIEAALAAEVLRQTIALAVWEARRVEWLMRGGCSGARGLAMPLPSLSWVRDPPDALGPGVLRWTGAENAVFRLKLHHSPRVAAAWVYAEGGSSNGNWKTSWTQPFR